MWCAIGRERCWAYDCCVCFWGGAEKIGSNWFLDSLQNRRIIRYEVEDSLEGSLAKRKGVDRWERVALACFIDHSYLECVNIDVSMMTGAIKRHRISFIKISHNITQHHSRWVSFLLPVYQNIYFLFLVLQDLIFLLEYVVLNHQGFLDLCHHYHLHMFRCTLST